MRTADRCRWRFGRKNVAGNDQRVGGNRRQLRCSVARGFRGRAATPSRFERLRLQSPRLCRGISEALLSGYRQLIARAHKRGVRVIGSTNPPFENSFLEQRSGRITFFTPEKEKERQKVNTWILTSGEFDGVIDFDAVVRDPSHPSQVLARYDSGDHLHPNADGYVASGNAIPLELFRRK